MSRRRHDEANVLHSGRYLALRVTAALPGEGPHPARDHGWEYVERCGARGVVAILALTDDDPAAGRLVLVEQHRPPVHANVIELPAGLVGDTLDAQDEDSRTAAARELEEETGYAAASLELLGRGPSSAGLTSEIIEIYRARGLHRVGPGGGDDSESITVHEVPLAELRSWLAAREREGRLVEPKVYAALALAGLTF